MAVAVRAVPTLILSPCGGVLADRMDRRLLSLITAIIMSCMALVFALFLISDLGITVGYVYGYTLVTGIGHAFNQPVRQALIANTVPQDKMANALALNAMTVTSMRLLGAILGGVLIETVGFHWNFFFETGLYLGMALLLVPMRTPYQEESTARETSPINNLIEGFRYILKEQSIFRLMLLNFFRTGIFAPLLLLLPAYTVEALGAGAGVGTGMMIAMGIGGVAATFAMSSWGFFANKGLVCLITLISGSVVITGLGISHWIWVSVPIMIVMGLSQSHFIVANQTLVQNIVPDTLRGRVSSVWHYEQGLIPLFSLLIGLFASMIGMSYVMIIYGGIAIIIGLTCLICLRDIRGFD